MTTSSKAWRPRGARSVLAFAVGGGLAVLSFSTPGFAQGLPMPPRHDARSPTGVSYGTGTFTHETRDLSIGGEFPQGLALDRTYISNVGGTLGAHGWVHNFSGMVISHTVPHPMGEEWPQYQAPWIFNVTVGGKSVGFRGGSQWPPATGGPVGTYEPITPSGASLVYTGTTLGNGRYIFTDSDGSVINFPLGYGPLRIQDWTMPDGTRLEFGYDPVTLALRSVISNRGYAILFEPTAPSGQRKVCAVNLTQHAIAPTSLCPAGVQSVTYSYTSGTYRPGLTLLASATDANGQTTTYGYVTPDRLGCITPPGQSGCQIQNSYTLCYEYNPENTLNEYRSEYVTAQQTATGEAYSYSYVFASMGNDPPRCQGPYGAQMTQTVNGTQVTSVTANSANLPGSIVDPLGRTTTLVYNSSSGLEAEPAQLAEARYPLGNAAEYYYDARGNLIRQVRRPVPGSGSPLESTAVYPSTCANRLTCNRPTSITDANGNTTDFTYSADHGGVLTETGPAPSPGAPRPQVRHLYEARHAFISNGSGGYVPAGPHIWIRTETSICRTSAATGIYTSPCATAGDEVRTTFEHGPYSGANNLLLRGQAVTADGVSLRTCYGYDRDGRKISETQPNANLASCP